MTLVTDVIADLSYYQLFDKHEKARWLMTDIPWGDIKSDLVHENDINNAKVSAFGELTTYSATRAFMQLFEDDIDFTQWLAVWLYEETKHPHVFTKWLYEIGCKTDGQFIINGRNIREMTQSKVQMLTFNIISEITACNMYKYFMRMTQEPVLKIITKNLARDEMRHANGFAHYCKKCIVQSGDPNQEKLKCLQTIWFSLQANAEGKSQHPVLLTLYDMKGVDTDRLHADVSQQIVSRLGKMLDIPIESPDAIYETYVAFKKQCTARKIPPSPRQVELRQ